MICKICNKDFTNNKLKYHITHTHKITDIEYYDTYLKKSEQDGICIKCNKKSTFISIIKGYDLICKNCKRPLNINNCQYCNKQFTDLISLSYHLSTKHNINTKELKQQYYDNYILKLGTNICKKCGSITSFIDFSRGYETLCNNCKKYKINICKICNKEFHNPTHIINTHHISVKDYYDKYFKKENEGYCKICGKLTTFININKGYQVHCSAKCAQKDNEVRLKYINTNIKKYGVEYPLQSENSRSKLISTNINKYGTEYGLQNDFIKAKGKQTKKEKYGDENYNNQEKAQQTCLKHYGVKHPTQNSKLQLKSETTQRANHNGKLAWNTEKQKQTMIEKYGASSILSTEYGKQKYKQTNLNRYGVEHTGQIISKKIKSSETFYKNMKLDNTLINEDL